MVASIGRFDFLTPCVDALAKIALEICTSVAALSHCARNADFNKALVAFFKTQLTASSP
jgi:hypothetical protein